MISERDVRQSLEELDKGGTCHTKRHQLKTGRALRPRFTFKQGQFGVAVIAGDHQRTVPLLRPILEVSYNRQAQDLLIPSRRRVTVRDEQLDMVDL